MEGLLVVAVLVQQQREIIAGFDVPGDNAQQLAVDGYGPPVFPLRMGFACGIVQQLFCRGFFRLRSRRVGVDGLFLLRKFILGGCRLACRLAVFFFAYHSCLVLLGDLER